MMVDCKSPGSPGVFMYSTNRDFKIHKADQIRSVVQSRVAKLIAIGKRVWNKQLLFVSTEDHVSIGEYLIRIGAADPVLLVRKSESRPMLPAKKRPRLVSSVSVVQNCCWRIGLHNGMVDTKSFNCPTAHNLDLVSLSSGIDMFKELDSHSPVSSSDVQGWEYSCNPELHWVACFRWCYNFGFINSNLELIHECDHFFYLIGLYFADLHKLVQTASGLLIAIPQGVVTSGVLTTFDDNSLKRAFLSWYMSSNRSEHWVKTAGDDCLSTPDFSIGDYNRHGFVITDHVVQTGEYNFCSTTFRKHGQYGDNIGKFFATLCRCSDEQIFDQTMTSFHDLYCRHPEYQRFCDLIRDFASSTVKRAVKDF